MDDQGQVTDQERLDSAHKLFGKKAEATLSMIDSIPNPASQSDPSTRNVEGVEDPAKWVIPQVDVAPPGDALPPAPKPKGPAFLDQIQDAVPAPRQPAGTSSPLAPAPAFLEQIPDVASPLHQAYQEASLFDAVHAATVRRLSTQFGQPPEFVDKNLAAAKAQANAPSPAFFKALEENYPGSSKFFQDPQNMAVAHDDMPNVVAHEDAVKSASDNLSLWGAFKLGLSQSVFGDVATGGKAQGLPKDLSIPQSLAVQAGQIIPDTPVMSVGAAVTAPIGAALGSEVPVVGNIAGAVIAGGAGAMGAPTAAHELLRMYRSGEIKSFPDLVRSFIDMEKKVGKQMFVGGVSSAAGVAAGPAGLAVALPVENAVMTTTGKLIEGETPKPRDYVENLLLGLGMHAATHAVTGGAAARVADVQEAQAKGQFYDAIGAAAEQSKLRERLPDVHSEFVNGLVKDGPFQNIYLPVEAATEYFQKKGIDIEDVAKDLGVSDSLEEARATGGDIQIPLASWLEKAVGTEHYKGLRDEIKFSREDLSTREKATIASETQARVKDAADEALKEWTAPESQEPQDRVAAAQKVYQDMQAKLSDAGLSAAEVKYNPMLFSDFFANLADKVNDGLPPEMHTNAAELQAQFPLDVRTFESPAARAAALEAQRQAALGDVTKIARKERIAMVRRALDAITDLHKDDAAEAFGLPKNAVRALKGVSERQGRGVYSKEEIRRAAGIEDLTREASFDQAGDEDARGSLSFKPGGKAFNLDLFKERNVSTFLHESGHYFLEVLGHVAGGDGDSPIQKDYQAIRNWLGLKDGEAIGTEQHERFARAFEQYLSEGKAPSKGLQEAFRTFKKWLGKLWQTVSFQKVDVSPEIRDVFDRMFASEDQIAEARKEVNLDKEFSAEGLDEKTKAEVERLREKARAVAEEKLVRERLKEMRPEYKEDLAKERARFQEAAEGQVREEPLFKAAEDLKRVAADPYELAARHLAGEASPVESTELGLTADEHGFVTPEDMAQQLVEAKKSGLFEQKVSNLVEEGLRQVGMINDAAQLREEALKAVHSEESERLIAEEREALLHLAAKKVVSAEQRVRDRAQAKLEVEAAKGEAGMILSKKPASEAGRPQPLITMEKNAAAKVARLLARKDYEKAAEAKYQQLVAHALVRESFQIQEEAAKHERYIEKFLNRRGSLLDMPYGSVRQIDWLLDRFGFQPAQKEDIASHQAIASGMAQEGREPGEIANATGLTQDAQGRWVPESLAQFVERKNDDYFAQSFPPEVLAGIRRDSKDLTIDELRAAREAIQTIAEQGRKDGKFLNELHKTDIETAALRFRMRVEKTFGSPKEDLLLPGTKEQGKLADVLDNLRNFPDALTRTLDTVLTTCHKFDGLEEGPAKEFIYRPMAEAEARATTRMRKSMEEMEAIFAKHYEPGEFEKYKETEVALRGRKYTKENILSMALNWGNAGNRQRLLSMPGLDEASARQLFTNLGKKDWDFVQATWDHIDGYWPEIKKLEMAVRGVEPGKVQAAAFKNEFGEYKGGYYPIAYDFEKSADAFQHNQSKDALFKQYSTARAATAQGHTEARIARVTRPLRLSLDVLANHHEDIIHDLEFRKAVIDLNRFLAHRDTKAGITGAVGVRGYAAIQDWLKSVAGGGSEPMSAWDRAAQWFRFKTTFFNLGYRIASAPKIAAENVINTASEIGWSGTARALKNYYLGDGSHELVVEKSPFMRERANHLDRDMGDLIDKQRGEGQSAFQKYAFFVHAYIDQGMSFPLWQDSYKRAIAEHGDERLAVHQADETVKRTFMTGGRVDQASFARGSELKKAMTIAYGYQSMMWNRFSRQMFQAGMDWNSGNHAQAAATMAMSTIYTLALPAMVATLTREFMRNGPPSAASDEKKRMLTTFAEEASPLKFVPLARDLQAFAIRGAAGERQRDLQLSPIEGMFQSLIEPVAQAASGKHSGHFGEQSVNALSFAFGIPKQVNDVAFNFLDWQHDHGAVTWRDALARRHKK